MSNLISTDDPFSSEQREALREILGYMIPAGGSGQVRLMRRFLPISW